ncbi:MAG: hypothetical protein Q4F31_03340 [Eubacteriales bacterium]|nr:hypothetical protein [Eubacteriales bacterium]
MKNSDLKLMIRSAYDVKSSEKKKAFIRAYQKRELDYIDILFLQFQYLGPQLTVVFGYALMMLLGGAAHINAAFARVLAAFMPAAALFALTGLGKSSKYAMEEIEMASRFSLRMIKILRLTIIGIAGITVMVAASFVLKIVAGLNLLSAFALTGVSYLSTTFLCMVLIRKWHSEKNIYGCVLIALVVCITMVSGSGMQVLYSAGFSGMVPAVLLLISVVLTVSEACKYIKESEEILWNLC